MVKNSQPHPQFTTLPRIFPIINLLPNTAILHNKIKISNIFRYNQKVEEFISNIKYKNK